MCGMAAEFCGSIEDERDRVTHRGDVLDGAVERRVERRNAKESAGGHLGDAHDDAAVVVQLELGSHLGILELRILLVLDHDEAVLGVDVGDVALDELRPAEEARIVEAEHGHRLVGPILQSHERSTRVEGDRILDAVDAADRVEHIVGHRNRAADVRHGAVHDPDLGPRVRDRRRRLLHHPREHRRHLNHEEHAEREPHEKGGELALVVDKQLVGDAKDPGHGVAMRVAAHVPD